MPKKLQSTSLNNTFGRAFDRLESWAVNPWRRYSLLIILLLTGFLLGSSIGMINGVLALMDPIGAFFTVLIIEMMVRFRKTLIWDKKRSVVLEIVDFTRIGLIYGLLMEGFKVL